MTMKIIVNVPPTNEQGSYKTTVSGSYNQTYRQRLCKIIIQHGRMMGLNR